MPTRKKIPMPIAHKKLTIADVLQLGRMLLDVSDSYPTQFLTERDFFPLVVAYLSGRVPSLATEVQLKGGVADFRLGGPNPTWLELAVQPRQLKDENHPSLPFPGHSAVNTLYAGQNATELKKLMREPKGTTRFLLLLDLAGTYKIDVLKNGYRKSGLKIGGLKPVRVVYVTRDLAKSCHFLVPKKTSKAKSKKK